MDIYIVYFDTFACRIPLFRVISVTSFPRLELTLRTRRIQ